MKYLLLMMLVLCSTAHGALIKQTVNYEQAGTQLEGYLVYDDAITTPTPGIIVVHEWKGLDDYTKSRADQLARLGYIAFAADIYGKGIRPTTSEEAGAQAGKYKKDRGLMRQRVTAALDILKKQENVDVNNIAAIGYCFGGTAALDLARSGADIKGAVSIHGGLSTGDITNQPITAKILVLHGADDPHVPAAEVEGFKKEMDATKADYQFISYPGAVHAFTNPNNKDEKSGAFYNKEADMKSWEEMKQFFNKIFAS